MSTMTIGGTQSQWGSHPYLTFIRGAGPASRGIPGEAGESMWAAGFVYGWEDDGEHLPPFPDPSVQIQAWEAARDLRRAMAQGCVFLLLGDQGAIGFEDRSTNPDSWTRWFVEGFSKPAERWLGSRMPVGHTDGANLRSAIESGRVVAVVTPPGATYAGATRPSYLDPTAPPGWVQRVYGLVPRPPATTWAETVANYERGPHGASPSRR